jgi:hypothetical protein
VRKVGKATAIALLTSMTAATVVALSTPADAAASCPILSLAHHATIAGPSGTVIAGSTVPVEATVCGVLPQVHLQLYGPAGIDMRVKDAQPDVALNRTTISGSVTVTRPGGYALALIDNLTGTTYATDPFTVQRSSVAAAPSQKTPSRSPSPTRAGSTTGSPLSTPSAGSVGSAGGIGSVRPLNQNSPFSLPSVTPDGAGVEYPTPDPEVAAAPSPQVQARDVAATDPVNWGRSIAIALVLLLLSAHFGMWSRRQRLAAEGARGGATGPSGAGARSSGRRRRKSRKGATTGVPGEAGITEMVASPTTDAGVAPALDADIPPTTASSATGAPGTPPQADLAVNSGGPSRAYERRSPSRHRYRGRRRRG